MASNDTIAEAGKEILAANLPSDFLSAWLRNSAVLPPEERATFSHYYGNFGTLKSERMRRSYDRQLEEVTSLVRARPGLDVLEVGAGCGTESLWFAFNSANVMSVDIKTDRLAVARKRHEILEEMAGKKLQCSFVEQSLLDMEGSDRFDVIWVQQTFHHLEPRAECVAAITRLLRPGGSVVMSEVNAWNPLIQALLLRRRGFKTITHYEDEEGNQILYGNERILTAAALKKWFRDAGLAEGDVHYYRVLPSSPRFDKLEPLERFVAAASIKPLYTHYNFVARKPA